MVISPRFLRFSELTPIQSQMQTRASTRMRMPQAGLREATSAMTNSRSGIMAPGTIANKALSMSRMEPSHPVAQEELTPPEATRTKAANPETRRVGSVARQPPPTTKTHSRGSSYASSTMTRSAAPASRTGPFSSTVGPGTRPASAMSRPQSFNGRRPVGASIPRAASALDTHMEDTSPSVLGKRKGMPQISLIPTRVASCPDGQTTPGLEQAWTEPSGIRSLSISEGSACSPAPSIASTVPFSPRTPVFRDYCGIAKPPALRTRVSSVSLFATPVNCDRTPSISPRRPFKKPSVPLFLTKESSTRSFDHVTGPEWDQDSREKNLDNLMKTLMDQMNQQGQASTGLKETVDLYKTRSESARKNLSQSN